MKCEDISKGTIVGIDPMPIDPEILSQLAQFGINADYARKCIEANKHNHITATYYLCLKKHLRNGGQSIADVRSPKYDAKVFLRRYGNLKDLTKPP